MVVRIRLQRHGHIYRPFYRVAIAHSERHVSKKVIDYVGTYDPLRDKLGTKQLRLNVPRIKYWLAVGAQPSDTVARLLAAFQLLPSPAVKKVGNPRANVRLMRALAGAGGADEVKGEQEGQPFRQPRVSWLFPAAQNPSLLSSSASSSSSSPAYAAASSSQSLIPNEIRLSSHFPRYAHRLLPDAPLRTSHGASGTKTIKSFPFDIVPTSQTLNAWQSARQRYAKAANTELNSSSSPSASTASPASNSQ